MRFCVISFFFFNDTATTEIYTLSLHDALPIFRRKKNSSISRAVDLVKHGEADAIVSAGHTGARSEEHTSELQSRPHLVCRLLLEKKKKNLVAQHSAIGKYIQLVDEAMNVPEN